MDPGSLTYNTHISTLSFPPVITLTPSLTSYYPTVAVLTHVCYSQAASKSEIMQAALKINRSYYDHTFEISTCTERTLTTARGTDYRTSPALAKVVKEPHILAITGNSPIAVLACSIRIRSTGTEPITMGHPWLETSRLQRPPSLGQPTDQPVRKKRRTPRPRNKQNPVHDRAHLPRDPRDDPSLWRALAA